MSLMRLAGVARKLEKLLYSWGSWRRPRGDERTTGSGTGTNAATHLS